MIDAMTTGQRQLLALIILFLLIGIAFSLTAAPLMSLNTHYLDNIDRLEQRLQILNRKVGTGDELRAKQIQLNHFLAINRHYLTSSTEALAAADLQGIIKRISKSSRAEVLSTQNLPPVKELGFTGVVVKVRMRGKLGNLVRVFHSLEADKPYLFLDNVSIRSRAQHSRKINFKGGRNARTLDLVETLDVEFDVTGYMLRKS